MANAKKNDRKSSVSVRGSRMSCPFASVCWIVGKSNVPVALYSQMMPTSIRIEPAMV